MGARPDAARQILRQQGVPQQQQQQAYVLPAVDALSTSSGRHSFTGTGYNTLASASAGVSAVQLGGSPAGLSPAAPAYGLRYASDPQQQAAGLYAPGMQYMLMPQQARAGVVAQRQAGDFLGVPVLQQQAATGEQAPPGLLTGSPGQQYYLAAPASQGLVMPGLGSAEAQVAAEGQQQLFLQPALQQAQAAARAGLGGMGQFGGYQASSGTLVPDAMTSTAYTPAVVGDMFLSGQQQPQAQRAQLQMLQQQMQPVGLYQQPQQQGYQTQNPSALYLQQQQQQQLPVMMYGLAGQHQQQFGAQQPGTFVLDPTTGQYFQQ